MKNAQHIDVESLRNRVNTEQHKVTTPSSVASLRVGMITGIQYLSSLAYDANAYLTSKGARPHVRKVAHQIESPTSAANRARGWQPGIRFNNVLPEAAARR
jgi:hypothetical protein